MFSSSYTDTSDETDDDYVEHIDPEERERRRHIPLWQDIAYFTRKNRIHFETGLTDDDDDEDEDEEEKTSKGSKGLKKKLSKRLTGDRLLSTDEDLAFFPRKFPDYCRHEDSDDENAPHRKTAGWEDLARDSESTDEETRMGNRGFFDLLEKRGFKRQPMKKRKHLEKNKSAYEAQEIGNETKNYTVPLEGHESRRSTDDEMEKAVNRIHNMGLMLLHEAELELKKPRDKQRHSEKESLLENIQALIDVIDRLAKKMEDADVEPALITRLENIRQGILDIASRIDPKNPMCEARMKLTEARVTLKSLSLAVRNVESKYHALRTGVDRLLQSPSVEFYNFLMRNAEILMKILQDIVHRLSIAKEEMEPHYIPDWEIKRQAQQELLGNIGREIQSIVDELKSKDVQRLMDGAESTGQKEMWPSKLRNSLLAAEDPAVLGELLNECPYLADLQYIYEVFDQKYEDVFKLAQEILIQKRNMKGFEENRKILETQANKLKHLSEALGDRCRMCRECDQPLDLSDFRHEKKDTYKAVERLLQRLSDLLIAIEMGRDLPPWWRERINEMRAWESFDLIGGTKKKPVVTKLKKMDEVEVITGFKMPEAPVKREDAKLYQIQDLRHIIVLPLLKAFNGFKDDNSLQKLEEFSRVYDNSVVIFKEHVDAIVDEVPETQKERLIKQSKKEELEDVALDIDAFRDAIVEIVGTMDVRNEVDEWSEVDRDAEDMFEEALDKITDRIARSDMNFEQSVATLENEERDDSISVGKDFMMDEVDCESFQEKRDTIRASKEFAGSTTVIAGAGAPHLPHGRLKSQPEDKALGIYDPSQDISDTDVRVVKKKVRTKTGETEDVPMAEPEMRLSRLALNHEVIEVDTRIRMCQAAHDYTAASPEELSLKRGELLNVQEIRPDGWWMCSKKDEDGYYTQGLAPQTFVNVVDPSDSRIAYYEEVEAKEREAYKKLVESGAAGDAADCECGCGDQTYMPVWFPWSFVEQKMKKKPDENPDDLELEGWLLTMDDNGEKEKPKPISKAESFGTKKKMAAWLQSKGRVKRRSLSSEMLNMEDENLNCVKLNLNKGSGKTGNQLKKHLSRFFKK